MPISVDIPEGQEVVDSVALEETLGIHDLDDDDAGDEPDDFIEEDEGPDPVDEMLDDGDGAGRRTVGDGWLDANGAAAMRPRSRWWSDFESVAVM